MIKEMLYAQLPSRGQALLNFADRKQPKSMPLYEHQLVEKVNGGDNSNLLIHGDCLSACAYLKNNNIKVDLVYIDPPFSSGANYAKSIFLRDEKTTSLSEAEYSLFEEKMYKDIWKKEDYLNWIYERLIAIREVMSETGSIYVHLDYHIGHYVKILLDEVFGEENFLNEIIWKRTSSTGLASKKCGIIHDNIFWYSKSDLYLFNMQFHKYEKDYLKRAKKDETGRLYIPIPTGNPGLRPKLQYTYKGYASHSNGFKWKEETIREYDEKGLLIFPEDKSGRIQFKQYLDEMEGVKLQDLWLDLPSVNPVAIERNDYQTQKPECLLERIIKASSNEGMIVADFFTGSGTTCKIANGLNRRFIGSDIGLNALQKTRDRLANSNASFNIIKLKDGITLSRQPSDMKKQLISLIDGWKNAKNLDIEFFDGVIPDVNGTNIYTKFIDPETKLDEQMLFSVLNTIYDLKYTDQNFCLIYVHKSLNVDQHLVDSKVKRDKRILGRVTITHIEDFIQHKSISLFSKDNALITVTPKNNKYEIKIDYYFSPYLKEKIDIYNLSTTGKATPVKLNENGHELIESVQFDTTLQDYWVSGVEDKASKRTKIKGVYTLPTNKFRLKIRNIVGDELLIDDYKGEI